MPVLERWRHCRQSSRHFLPTRLPRFLSNIERSLCLYNDVSDPSPPAFGIASHIRHARTALPLCNLCRIYPRHQVAPRLPPRRHLRQRQPSDSKSPSVRATKSPAEKPQYLYPSRPQRRRCRVLSRLLCETSTFANVPPVRQPWPCVP